jgi:hypothetical protein
MASSTGRDESSTVGSTSPSCRAATSSSSPSRSSASVKTTWTWVEVSSAETISASHLRLTRSTGHGRGHPSPGEVGRVEDPDGVGCVADPVRERLADRPSWPRQRPQPQALALQHAAHAGRRHPHPLQGGAAVSQLAVGAVDLAPRIEQPHDLGDLLLEQAVHRAAARGLVGELAGGAATQPPEGPHLTKLGAPRRRHGMSTRLRWPAQARPAARTWWPDPPAAGPGHSAPTPFSLHQQQPDGQLLERLAQPCRLRPGRLQLQVPLGLGHAGLGVGQRL